MTWCAPHVPDRHGLPIAFRDEAAMKALAAANAEYQKNRAKEKAKQVFIDIIKEKHAVGKRRRDEEAARAARGFVRQALGRRLRVRAARRGNKFFNLRRAWVCVVIPSLSRGRLYQRDVVSEFGPKPPRCEIALVDARGRADASGAADTPSPRPNTLPRRRRARPASSTC